MNKKYRAIQILLYLSLFISFSPAIALAVESTIISRQVKDCHIRIEFDQKWKVMIVRSARNDYERCNIDRDILVNVLADAFKKLLSTEEHKKVESVFLGRIISYTWLSEHIKSGTEKSETWDLIMGKPKKGEINAFVGDLIFKSKVITDLNVILKPYGLYVSGVSAEKVLVTDFFLTGSSGKGKLPYDALVWFVIRSENNIKK
jgi:hypothetical protein